MSELDKWFGPQLQREHEDTGAKKHDWGRCATGVSEWLDHFVEYSLLSPPYSHSALASWRKGARNFIEEYGEDKELVRKTIQFMKSRGWYVVDPHSIFKTARMVKSKPDADSEQRRRRYLEGID